LTALRPAIFLDRDGTLNHEVGYVNHLSRFRLYPFAVDAIRLVNRSSYLAVLVTNQAGVARGYFPEALVKDVHASLVRSLEAGGARLDGLYYCPHHPTAGSAPYRCDCDCRKPRTGLLKRAEAELGIDLTRSWMVGDRSGDVELAHRAGARAVLVRTGYGRGDLEHHGTGWKHAPAFVADHVLEAVQHILSLDGGGGGGGGKAPA
jgi:D-glycero-D-manno-heptose 1,7-bisphosphate phosphatase